MYQLTAKSVNNITTLRSIMVYTKEKKNLKKKPIIIGSIYLFCPPYFKSRF